MNFFKKNRNGMVVYTAHQGNAVVVGNRAYNFKNKLTADVIREVEADIMNEQGFSWCCVTNIIWLEG